jgi:hypothetical protein
MTRYTSSRPPRDVTGDRSKSGRSWSEINGPIEGDRGAWGGFWGWSGVGVLILAIGAVRCL